MSYRFIGRCTDLVTVDLNSLLYKVEGHTSDWSESQALSMPDGRSETASDWIRRAEKRRDLVNTYLWDRERGMYSDYDFVRMSAPATSARRYFILSGQVSHRGNRPKA